MSFRQFGGMNYSGKHNYVSSNYSSSNLLSISKQLGQPNSIIAFESDISNNVSLQGNLSVSGQIAASSYITTSDYRVKENVKKLSEMNEKNKFDFLNPVEYDAFGRHDYGFIAHEVKELFPCLVNGEKDDEHLQSINYQGIIALLVNEVKILKKKINQLEGILCKE